MLLETRMATATVNAEMDFTWAMANTVAPEEIINKYIYNAHGKRRLRRKILDTLEDPPAKKSVEALEELLRSCTVCPKDCGNDRLQDEIAACYSGRLPIVSSYTAHFGEEPCLSGTRGAGNIFFRQLQSSLRLLPELSDLANLERAEKERGDARTPCRNDA